MLILSHRTSLPTTSIGIAIWILPEELTLEWDKQPLGDQVVINVATLFTNDNMWQCKYIFTFQMQLLILH